MRALIDGEIDRRSANAHLAIGVSTDVDPCVASLLAGFGGGESHLRATRTDRGRRIGCIESNRDLAAAENAFGALARRGELRQDHCGIIGVRLGDPRKYGGQHRSDDGLVDHQCRVRIGRAAAVEVCQECGQERLVGAQQDELAVEAKRVEISEDVSLRQHGVSARFAAACKESVIGVQRGGVTLIRQDRQPAEGVGCAAALHELEVGRQERGIPAEQRAQFARGAERIQVITDLRGGQRRIAARQVACPQVCHISTDQRGISIEIDVGQPGIDIGVGTGGEVSEVIGQEAGIGAEQAAERATILQGLEISQDLRLGQRGVLAGHAARAEVTVISIERHRDVGGQLRILISRAAALQKREVRSEECGIVAELAGQQPGRSQLLEVSAQGGGIGCGVPARQPARVEIGGIGVERGGLRGQERQPVAAGLERSDVGIDEAAVLRGQLRLDPARLDDREVLQQHRLADLCKARWIIAGAHVIEKCPGQSAERGGENIGRAAIVQKREIGVEQGLVVGAERAIAIGAAKIGEVCGELALRRAAEA